jgi:hypothetical protein
MFVSHQTWQPWQVLGVSMLLVVMLAINKLFHGTNKSKLLGNGA